MGLSRKHIFQAVEQSLKRLDTDYIDLLVIHRWDYDTPIEETMRALNDLVKSGKVLYIGASAMYAWQFQKAQNIAERNGRTKFISMQNHYNLLYREDEHELLPYCKDANIQLTPYSPLGCGQINKGLAGGIRFALKQIKNRLLNMMEMNRWIILLLIVWLHWLKKKM